MRGARLGVRLNADMTSPPRSCPSLRAFSMTPSVATRFQEIIEETFLGSGDPSLGDFLRVLQSVVDRLRGVKATLQRLQARHDAFVAGLVDDHRRRSNAAAKTRRRRASSMPSSRCKKPTLTSTLTMC
ncbi:hypothetical protein E2562_027031 [Oryza meyeriana var. granulata]|uniref:Uncharacterized protein n=1 Tax=Oryza meyeriana var. granulata TaxID=110450 RepID=A0A6G1C998_9ORYZ|nr:hypothetical protein E2562_027031 [Oryza meyeriana var. granulata]